MTVKKPRWTRTAVAAATALLLVFGGVALAQGGDTYTGCLKEGKIDEVAIGTEPANPCKSGEVQISWNEEGVPGQDGGDQRLQPAFS